MLEVLSMLGGGVLRLIPFLVDLFKQKQDAEHEYRMTQLQLQIDQARATQQIDLAHAQAAIASAQGEMDAWASAIKAEGTKTGIGWVDAISATVRPVLTYYWCVGLYGAGKVLQVVVAWQAHSGLADYVPIVITEFDRSVIGSTLAFWFVDRALRKMQGR
jgi:hypothetical protein